MKVVDAMMGTPYYCQPDSNLGFATELMWKGNCGFLPVLEPDGRVAGVLTDRDICIALGTRGLPCGRVRAADAMSRNVRVCAPDDELKTAMTVMRDGRVRRLPVVTKDGRLVGVISMDDILLRSSSAAGSISPEEIVSAFRAINTHELSLVAPKAATA